MLFIGFLHPKFAKFTAHSQALVGLFALTQAPGLRRPDKLKYRFIDRTPPAVIKHAQNALLCKLVIELTCLCVNKPFPTTGDFGLRAILILGDLGTI